METDDEFEMDEICVPVHRFNKWVFLMHFMGMLMGLFNTVGVFFEGMTEACVAAANKDEMDTKFHEQAALELETLTEGGSDV